MQTYYDNTLKKWVTRQADGTVRDATNAEVLDAYSRGAQAPAGTPSPALPSPTPTTGDAYTSTPNAWGQSPTQTNYGWGTGFTGSHAGQSSPFADLTGTQSAYYQLHPDQANYLLRTWLAPNPSSPLNQYLAGRQADMTNDFATASAQSAQPNLQYTDWLKQNFGKYVDQFAGQSASQRGENPLSFGGGFAGRKAFS